MKASASNDRRLANEQPQSHSMTNHHMQNTTTNQLASRLVADNNHPLPPSPEVLEDYRHARDCLRNYIRDLEQELATAKAALDGEPTPVAVNNAPPPPCRHGKKYPYGSLTRGVADLLQDGPKTKRQIVEGLRLARFEYFGKDPLVLVDSVLYTKRFQRNGKLFSLAAEKSEGRD
jgi:hypothetical protein